jgi:hypothetical protein
MDVIGVLQVAALLTTAGIGALAFVRPLAVTGFTGLTASGARGVSELRAIFGGLFLGLGLAPLALATADAYQVAGITYLAIAATRTFSVLYDKSYARSNIISAITEWAFGVILVV